MKFLLRNRLTVKQRIEKINYEEDVVLPLAEAALAGKAVPEFGLKEGALFESIEVLLENPNPTQTADASGDDSDRTGKN